MPRAVLPALLLASLAGVPGAGAGVGTARICDRDGSPCADFTFSISPGVFFEPIPVFTAIPPGRTEGACGRTSCGLTFQLAAPGGSRASLLAEAPRPLTVLVDGNETGSLPASAWRTGSAVVGGDVVVPGVTVAATVPLPPAFGQHVVTGAVVDDRNRRVETTLRIVRVLPPKIILLPRGRSGEVRVRVERLREELTHALKPILMPPLSLPAPPYPVSLRAALCRDGRCGRFAVYDRRTLTKPVAALTLRARLRAGRYLLRLTVGGRTKRVDARVR